LDPEEDQRHRAESTPRCRMEHPPILRWFKMLRTLDWVTIQPARTQALQLLKLIRITWVPTDHNLMPSWEAKSCRTAGRTKSIIKEQGRPRRTIQFLEFHRINKWGGVLTDISTTTRDNLIKLLTTFPINHRILANPKSWEHRVAVWTSFRNTLKIRLHSK
jgi:hypothetical protein